MPDVTKVDHMGRLARSPNPILLELLYDPALREDRRYVLPYLLRIDAAHILMLSWQGILRRPAASRLLAVNRELAERLRRGEEVFDSAAPHRGLYWLYEREYVERLGGEVGGAAHVARSRNDINATVTRLRMRDETLALLEACDELLQAACERAEQNKATLMSGFTHLQPAQPSSLGHYLTGVSAEILRSAEWIASSFPVLNCSPMGAAAGGGTSFPIDRERVASWLGFDEVIANSADAVATRDYVVQILSGLALVSTALTRLATDLQSWASFAYGFLTWPDDLVSTSSIMPQKRNAFVWENVRGQATAAMGGLVSTLIGLKNTPFANSVEVSGEATSHAWPALRAGHRALQLTALLLAQMEVRPERMRRFLDGAQTTSTALADLLVSRYGLAFRGAHDAVGALLRDLPEGCEPTPALVRERLEAIVGSALGHPLHLGEAEIAAALDPERSLLAARHGGGPAPEAVEDQLRGLAERRFHLHRQIAAWRQGLGEAGERLEQAIEELLKDEKI